jgi:hypothetical protein
LLTQGYRPLRDAGLQEHVTEAGGCMLCVTSTLQHPARYKQVVLQLNECCHALVCTHAYP